MSRRKIRLLFTIAALFLGAVILVLSRRGTARHDTAASASGSPAPSAPTIQQTAASNGDPTPSENERQTALVKQGFEAIFEGLKKAGGKEIPPIEKQLRDAVEAGDHGTITRAFHEAIYDSFTKMNEAIPALKRFLNHPDPFVRLQAAEKLYTVGDPSGYIPLLNIIGAAEPVLIDGSDGRITAARLLAKFRERRASSAIASLYQMTKDSSVLNALVRVAGEDTPADIVGDLVHAKQPAFALFNLALTGAPEVAALAEESFPNPKVPEVYEQETKNIAAWAAIRAGAKEPYTSFLVQQAERALRNERPQGVDADVNQFKTAFKYVASIPDAGVKDLLERALNSTNQEIVQIAAVNLLFNQPGGSEKAKQVVLRELRGEQRKLGTELMLNVASKLDDPEIRAAGEAFDQRSGDRSWKLYSGERRQWPIYNWIDNYVVALNQ